MDILRELLQQLGFAPALSLAIILVLTVLGWVYTQNWWSIKDRVNIITRQPSRSPKISMTIEVDDSPFTWKDSKPVQIKQPCVYLRNDDEVAIVNITPLLVIDEVAIDDDSRKIHIDYRPSGEKSGPTYKLSPKGKPLLFPMFDKIEWSERMRIEIEGIGYLLDRKFKLTGHLEYNTEINPRKYKTQTILLSWSWHQPDVLQDKIEVLIYDNAMFEPGRQPKRK